MNPMKLVGKGKIIDYPNLRIKKSLLKWATIFESACFSNPNELKKIFPNADIVKDSKGNNLTVFNIGGNEARLIASIDYENYRLRIREILTHSEYDKGKWKN